MADFKLCVCVCVCVHSQSCLTLQSPWTVAHQAPLSSKFSRQEYWSGLPFPSPGDFPDPRIEPVSLASPALTGGFFTTAAPGKPLSHIRYVNSFHPAKDCLNNALLLVSSNLCLEAAREMYPLDLLQEERTLLMVVATTPLPSLPEVPHFPRAAPSPVTGHSCHSNEM